MGNELNNVHPRLKGRLAPPGCGAVIVIWVLTGAVLLSFGFFAAAGCVDQSDVQYCQNLRHSHEMGARAGDYVGSRRVLEEPSPEAPRSAPCSARFESEVI